MSSLFSDWHRIDLHIHTDLSRETKDNDYKGIFSISKLKEKLIENNVGIFSLTDHNIINVKAYEEYYHNCSETDPLLLLGMELDILVTKENPPYHSLLIFNISEIKKVKNISSKLEALYKDKNISNKKERIVSIEDIVTIFPEEDFFFIPHAYGSKNILDGHKGQIEKAQKMVLLMQSAFEKVPAQRQQIYNDGFALILSDDFKNRQDLAYIDFSDNHNIEKYPCIHKGDKNINHEFYYIKGSKSYETIRLAFIDPYSRIKSQQEYDKINRTLNTISSLKIDENKSLKSSELHFSPHLNVIIGGRSSGKSLLMNLIGEKIDSIETGKHQIYKDVADINHVFIKTGKDHDYKKISSLNSNFIYINQGDIVKYFEENNLEELAKKSSKIEEYKAVKEEFGEHKNNFKSCIDQLATCYKNTYDFGVARKFILHKSTLDKILSKHHVAIFKDSELLAKYNKQKQINESLDLINSTIENINKILNDKNIQFSKSEHTLTTKFQNLLNEKLKLLHSKSILIKQRVEFIHTTKSLIADFNQSQNSEAKERLSAKEEQSQLITDIKRKLQTYLDFKIASDALETFAYFIKKEILLKDDVSLVLEAEAVGSLKKIFLDGINNADISKSLYENLNMLLTNTKGVTIKNFKTNAPRDFNKKLYNQLNTILEALEEPKDYLDYKQNNETSKNKSPGFNSEKYLEIILQNKNNELIFIDQPEDNLGNRFIAERLVEIIREIKFSKQLFLVTHNPSIVVYGDAESIIIAENNDQKIEYRQIVLEDKMAQEEICSILDGGKYVFNNRSRKYNIIRILREEEENAKH